MVVLEEDPITYQDPFRMSVLDFQRKSLDKLAEIIKILLKHVQRNKILGDSDAKVDTEDIYYQLKHIKNPEYKQKYVAILKVKSPDDLVRLCDRVLNARNYKAHQAYFKDGITPPIEQARSKSKLGAQKRLPLDKLRTFEHTTDVISACLEFANQVLCGFEANSPMVNYNSYD